MAWYRQNQILKMLSIELRWTIKKTPSTNVVQIHTFWQKLSVTVVVHIKWYILFFLFMMHFCLADKVW